jgi:hypothetical protein
MIPPDVHRIDGIDHQLARAWPRSVTDVPLELTDAEGGRVVGRWFEDTGRASSEARRIRGARLGDDPRLLLQPAGADRKLPGLAALLADGDQLIAHRPGRRAVVRTRSGSYLKLTRAGRAPGLAARHEWLSTALEGYARMPVVRTATDERLELSSVSGTTPLEVSDRCDALWDRVWERVGSCLDVLANTEPATGLPVHDSQQEVEVTLSWVQRAVAANRLPDADPIEVLEPLTRCSEPPTALAHRDLHDGQLLFDGGLPGLLDPDTLAVAEPALDLANLLVHLDLRVQQGALSSRDRHRARDAVLQGAAPSVTTLRRLHAYERATRLRLAAVYAFRPTWHDLARRWFDLEVAGRDPVTSIST